MLVEIICRDKFGNLVEWGDKQVELVAQGVQPQPFEHMDTKGCCMVLAREFSEAGIYQLAATMNGRPFPLQLQSLQIIPGPLAVEQSTLHGRGLDDVQCFEPCQVCGTGYPAKCRL